MSVSPTFYLRLFGSPSIEADDGGGVPLSGRVGRLHVQHHAVAEGAPHGRPHGVGQLAHRASGDHLKARPHRQLDGVEAERVGLVSQVVAEQDLDSFVDTLAKEIGSRNGASISDFFSSERLRNRITPATSSSCESRCTRTHTSPRNRVGRSRRGRGE